MHINKTFNVNENWPERFKFPQSYLSLIEKGLPDIEPWWWLTLHKDSLIYWNNTLREQFPLRILISFAKHGGSDDIACFDGSDNSGNTKVLCIHSFCSPGWELRGEEKNFDEWLKKTERETHEFYNEL